MAIRRTLKQKKEAEVRRETTYEWQAQRLPLATGTKPSVSIAPNKMEKELFGYSIKLIYQDLLKTVVVSGVLGLALVALKFWKL